MKFLYTGIIVAILILPFIAYGSNNKNRLIIDTMLDNTSSSASEIQGVISNFSFVNGSKICPSNQCKVITNNINPIELFLSNTSMMISGSFRLQDNTSNGHFTPKMQVLVDVNMFSSCHLNDVKENLLKRKTLYNCGDKSSLLFTRTFNHTTYSYDPVVMTFELPSKHLIIQAEEK